MVDAPKRTPCQLTTDLQVSIIHYDRFALLQRVWKPVKSFTGPVPRAYTPNGFRPLWLSKEWDVGHGF